MSNLTADDYRLLKQLNRLYDIGPTKSADAIIARYRSLQPAQRLLLCKGLRASADLPHLALAGQFRAKAAVGDGPKIISGTASSTTLDLDNDTFAEQALRDMLALRGASSYLSHSYRVPEDILGTITETSIRKMSDGSALDIAVRVEETNPRALQTWQMIRNGTKIGFSVGVLVLESHYFDLPGGKQKALSIDRCLPLEVSAVGIPAQWRDAWATAAKGLRRV